MGKNNKVHTETKTEKVSKNIGNVEVKSTTPIKQKEEPRRNELKNNQKSAVQQITTKDNKVSSNQHKKEVEKNKKNKINVEDTSESDSDSIEQVGFNEEDIDEEVQTNMKKVYLEKLSELDSKLMKVLSEEQIKKAVDSLKILLNQHFEKTFDIFARKEEEMLQINFSFTTLPLKYSPRPVIIPVKLQTSVVRKVCLIIKDKFVQTWKELNLDFSSDKNNKFELDVIPFSSLKQEYALYEKKRNLVKLYDLFLCDKSLYMMLRKVLGKAFYNAKKYPLALTFENTDPNTKSVEEKSIDKKEAERIRQDILNAATNATFYMSNGPNYTIKTAYLNEEKTDKLVPKVLNAIKHTLAHILKWGVDFEGLKTISLKFTNSIELPVFNQLTEDEIKAYYGKIEEKEKKNKKEKIEKQEKNEKLDKKEKHEKKEKNEKRKNK